MPGTEDGRQMDEKIDKHEINEDIEASEKVNQIDGAVEEEKQDNQTSEEVNQIDEAVEEKKQDDSTKKGGGKKMPRKNRKRGRPSKKKEDEETVKLSLNDLKYEYDDTLFHGTISYLKLQKQYKENPKTEQMTISDFEAKIEEFKQQKIYKKDIMESVGDSQ